MSDTLLFRRSILLQLDVAYPVSLSIETISTGLKIAGFDFSENELLSSLHYLSEKGLLSLQISKISAEHKRAKLSALGKEYIESGDF